MTAAPRLPDLQQLVTVFGGFTSIPAQVWAEHGREVAAVDKLMRESGLATAKPTSTPTPAGTLPVDTMAIVEVAHELKAGAVALAGGAVITDAHRARRQQLWRRLDALIAAGRRAAP